MSWFTTLVQDTESFTAKFEQELAKLWGKAPTVAAIANTTLTFVGPLVEAIFAIEAPAAAPGVTAIINQIQASLLSAQGLIIAVGITPSLTSVIKGAASDVQDLITLGQIKDPTSISNTKLILQELNALAAILPAQVVTTAPAVLAPVAPTSAPTLSITTH
jgi:uncharacterized membrane protein